MKLSISNIAWDKKDDEYMYEYINNKNYKGLEIAPTRIFPVNPYDQLELASDFSNMLKRKHDLEISSMQSIWYGRNEQMFKSKQERERLFEYTKKAIDFAGVIKCTNIVFGCPKSRVINNQDDIKIAVEFFNSLGEYAKEKGTVLSIEPNPIIYNTNFINTTKEAFEFVKIVDSDGIKVNIDLGTVIYNKENLNDIGKNIDLVNHIHISEPNLIAVERRDMHKELANILKDKEYNKFVSIEMGKCDTLDVVKNTIEYLNEVFR